VVVVIVEVGVWGGGVYTCTHTKWSFVVLRQVSKIGGKAMGLSGILKLFPAYFMLNSSLNPMLSSPFVNFVSIVKS
jgi:hypothetical protein